MTRSGTVKVAITTNSLTDVDAGFASAGQVVLYSVSSDEAEFLDCVQFRGGARKGVAPGEAKGPGGGRGCAMDDLTAGIPVDRLNERVEAVADCGILFTLGLSDLHAVHVKRRGVFPVKMERPRSVDDVLANVQSMLKVDPPPLWLRRALRAPDGGKLGMADQVE